MGVVRRGAELGVQWQDLDDAHLGPGFQKMRPEALLAVVIYDIRLDPLSGMARRSYARFSKVAEGLFGTAFGARGITMTVRVVRGA